MSKHDGARVSHKEETTLGHSLEYLEALLGGLRAGTVRLELGDESITVRPQQKVTMKVKARSRPDRESISFELRWRTDGAAEGGSDLNISDKPGESSESSA